MAGKLSKTSKTSKSAKSAKTSKASHTAQTRAATQNTRDLTDSEHRSFNRGLTGEDVPPGETPEELDFPDVARTPEEAHEIKGDDAVNLDREHNPPLVAPGSEPAPPPETHSKEDYIQMVSGISGYDRGGERADVLAQRATELLNAIGKELDRTKRDKKTRGAKK